MYVNQQMIMIKLNITVYIYLYKCKYLLIGGINMILRYFKINACNYFSSCLVTFIEIVYKYI